MNQNPSTPGNFSRSLLFFSALLCALLISVWARAGQVTLAWDPNTESDLAGYRVHYGTASGSYTVTVEVDKSTPTCTILNLSAGQTYYFAATAYTASGSSSGYSNEVSQAIAVPIAPDRDGDGIPDAEDLDNDNDGMPDAWEIAHGLNPLVNDAAGDLDGDGISNLAEYLAGSDPTVPAPNDPPQAPVPVAPANRAQVALNPTLQTGAFADPDAGDRHVETRWQIVQGSSGLVVLDVTSAEELTQLTVPSLVLDENTEYYWRAAFYDQRGAASAWSAEAWFTTDFSLTDSNGNGIPDDQETQPVEGSGEGAKTVQTRKGNTKVAIGAQPSSGVAVIAVESIDPEDDVVDVDVDGVGDELPFGLVNFKVVVDTPGDEVTLTVYFSEPVPAKGKWYKYDPIRKRWFDYSRFATFSSDRLSMTLVLADGGAGDADGVVNGIIIDPAGVLVESSGGGGGGIVGGVVDGVGSVVSSIGGAAGGSGCFIATAAGDGGPGRWLAAALAALAAAVAGGLRRN